LRACGYQRIIVQSSNPGKRGGGMSTEARRRSSGWYRLRFEVLERDEFTCQYCGQHAPNVKLEVDHKVALCDGGRDVLDNLVTSCWACNRGKEGLRSRSGRVGQAPASPAPPTIQSKILDALRDGGSLTVAELASRLSIKNPHASKELTGLKHQGKVVQMGRGMWGLAEITDTQETH